MEAVPKTPFYAGLVAAILLATGLDTAAQVAGEFVTPAFRRGSPGASFAYWDLFEAGTGGGNFLYDNPPALFGGIDFDGNVTDLTEDDVVLVQTGTDTAFLTSSGAIYSFAEPVEFEVRFSLPASAGDVTNVVFQTQTGGVRLELGDVSLDHDADAGSGPTPIALAPDFKALDDPQTGGFSERLVSALQWDLTGLGVRDFVIRFRSPNSSMPLWESQLDVVMGEPFIRALGFLLVEETRPTLRFGVPGTTIKELPPGAEERFHLPGDTFDLLSEAEPGFAAVGFIDQDGIVSEAGSLTITFGSEDLTAGAIFAPRDYATWRDGFFFHFNSLTGQTPDNSDDAISGREADPDADGLTNFAEYAFGCDPYVADVARATPQVTMVADGGQPFVELTYRCWGAEPVDVSYAVQVSAALGAWSEATDAFVEVRSELQEDGTRLVSLRSLQPVEGAEFYTVTAQ